MSWTLALLSPRDFSPHRRPDGDPGPAALSLLVCGRVADYSNYVRNLLDTPRNVFLTNVEEIPPEVSNQDAERRLLATTSKLAYFAVSEDEARATASYAREEDAEDLRCALSIVASVALARNDLAAEAVEICKFAADLTPTDPFYSAILALQLSMHQFSVGNYGEASESAALAEQALRDQQDTRLTDPGLSASLVKVYVGLRSAAKDNRNSFTSRADGVLEMGEIDEELQFGRFWLEKEAYLEDGSSSYLTEIYQRRVRDPATTSRPTRIGGGDKVDSKLSVYHTLCELAGHWKRSRDSAGILGREKIARATYNDAGQIADGLALLRRYSHQRSLLDALRITTARGPYAALESETTHASANLLQRPFDRTTLTTVRFTADLMTEEQCNSAIDIITSGTWPSSEVDAIGWYRVEEHAIQTLSALVRRSKAPSEWLARLRETLDSANDLATQQMTSVVSEVRWSSVTSEECAAWREWAAANLRGDAGILALEVLADQARAGVTQALDELVNAHLEAPSPRLAAALIDLKDLLPQDVTEQIVTPTTDLCVGALARVRREAQEHTYGFGGQDAGVLTAAAAALFNSETLWDALTNFLVDPAVAPSHKSASFEWLAFYIEKVPTSVTEALVRNRDTLERGSTVDLFGDMNDSSSAVFRLMCAAGGISFERSLVDFLSLASDSDVRRRVESARSARYVSLRSSPDVVVPVLLKLANDEAPIAQVSAVRALVHIALGLEEPLRSLTYRAIESALRADGYANSMAVVDSLREEVSEGSYEVARNLRFTLEEVAENHQSDRVRTSTRTVLNRIGQA